MYRRYNNLNAIVRWNSECSFKVVRIGSDKFESFAYAEDVNLFCASVPGVQKMIDIV